MKPFEIYVDTGSAAPVKFTLDDATLRGAGIKVRYALEDSEGDPDERTRMWRGALVVARALLAAKDNARSRSTTAPTCESSQCMRSGGSPKPDGTRLDELRRRLRLAYVDGAGGWSRETSGVR